MSTFKASAEYTHAPVAVREFHDGHRQRANHRAGVAGEGANPLLRVLRVLELGGLLLVAELRRLIERDSLGLRRTQGVLGSLSCGHRVYCLICSRASRARSRA